LKDIQDQTRFIALVKPLNAVDIRPQVAGEIKEVLFTDGQFVNEGDVLFLIDPDKYQANLAVAKATLAKAEADVKQLKSDYNRQNQLYKDKFVSTADLEKSESRLAQAQAAVKQAQANLSLAEIDLKHTEVKSPISGRIGQALITKGNYVNAANGALARIVQTTPVKISFSITDKEHLQMKKMLQKNGQAEIPQMKLELADKSVLPLPVDKVYWDNEMDVQTATVNLYAEYENSDELLIPNDHLNVLWQNTQPKTVVMVPQTALYNDASGSYVMKLNGDNTVIQQYVTKGENIDGQIVIEDRLTAQDKIVVSGGQKLRNGQTIQPIETKAE
jgi:membrane fusion protein (multidrug efflux system)